MNPADSPFPCQWWGIGLDRVGLADVRPSQGTYGRYDSSLLPPAPADLRGDFAWLTSCPPCAANIAQERAAENAAALPRLRAAAGKARLALPRAFLTFVGDPALGGRVRSCTDCFLALDPEPSESPLGGGWLVRFLSDSQGCLHWYLYLAPDEPDHAVVCSPDVWSGSWEEVGEEAPDPAGIVFAAGSFEEFLWRFWVENEIWLAGYQKTPLSDPARAYVDVYRRRAGERRDR